MVEIPEENFLMHYGIIRRSGRYPWGSGGNVATRSKKFYQIVDEMLAAGMTEKEIAAAFTVDPDNPFTTTKLRQTRTLAKNELKAANVSMAVRLRDRGNSVPAIAERMGIPKETVRSYLKPGADKKAKELRTLVEYVRERVDEDGIIDIGLGVAERRGISPEKLGAAISVLQDEGYRVHKVPVPQGGRGTSTQMKVITPPGTTQNDAWKKRYEIKQLDGFSTDTTDFIKALPPKSVDSSRLQVRYDDDGGKENDGVVYVRRGVEDLSLGGKPYGQVRIMIDGTHYVKGMAVMVDDLPPGVDLQFNVNKKRTGNKLDALKPIEDSPISPFKSVVRQDIGYDNDGNPYVKSALNIVGTKDGSGVEGAWGDWSKTLPSQFLSKQPPSLIQEQLRKTQEKRMEDFEEIKSLTNPSIKKKLLESFADETDSAAVHMKAVAFKDQSTHVILPVNTMKETEIYAPNFDNGTRVALVRFPHGGRFEIPQLTVNNNHPQAKKLLGNAEDAVGINSKVAEVLSGADFDGDTVLVIPNNSNKVKSKPPLAGLEGFEPKKQYAGYEGMKTIDGGVMDAKGNVKYGPKGKNKQGTQTEMGKISNLINDMSIRGAPDDELARAVRHSMVVIDAEKHKLDYKTSAQANGIKDLTDKYQKPYNPTNRAGASTLLSRSTSDMEIPARKPRTYKTHPDGPVDPKTGKRMYEPKFVGESQYDKRTGKIRTMKIEKGAYYDDPYVLTSGGSKKTPGTRVEGLYAEHATNLKSLANTARLEALRTKPTPYNAAAAKAYKPEVEALTSKIRLAKSKAPLERQAQVLQKVLYKARTEDSPPLDKDQQKKLTYQTLKEARAMTGAEKSDIKITDSEWAAIQSGAVSPNKMNDILRYTNVDEIKKRALPRTQVLMSSTKINRAQALLAGGATQAEVARTLGVSLTTLKDSLSS